MSAPHSPAQHEEAARFFDGVSTSYREKYAHQSPFHRYYFNERLEKAVQGLDLAGKDVLDIGSGTGNLFDHLTECFPTMRFFATDVSSGMLAQSRVPQAQRFVGHAYDHTFPVQRFDAVFMLGVTTYLSPEELERNLAFMARSLKPGGRAIITFSNKHGLDTWMRALVRTPMRWLGRTDKVLASGLRLHTYSAAEVRRLLAPHFVLEELDVHNHTVFPFGLLLPGPSIAVARWLARKRPTALVRWLSSDLLARAAART